MELTKKQVEEIKQWIVAEIGDFARPADEIRHPAVTMLRDMIDTDAALRTNLADAETSIKNLQETCDQRVTMIDRLQHRVAEVQQERDKALIRNGELREEAERVADLMCADETVLRLQQRLAQVEQERDTVTKVSQQYVDDIATAQARIRSCTQIIIATIGSTGPENLEEALGRITARVQALEEQYHELIMAVGSKFPGETRHKTALKYIQRAEQITCREPAQQALTPARKQGNQDTHA